MIKGLKKRSGKTRNGAIITFRNSSTSVFRSCNCLIKANDKVLYEKGINVPYASYTGGINRLVIGVLGDFETVDDITVTLTGNYASYMSCTKEMI